ncbi:MAG: hypothetical protein IKW38_00040 [Kiritimatiellae bacterium]|nr:hypothetical protein [Kiritimatiellia bacterium]
MKTAWIKSFLTHLLPMGTRLLPCIAGVLLAEAARAESITVTAETIGINFALSGAAMSSESTTPYGFATLEKGGLLAENKWQGFYAGSNNNPMVVGQAYTITTAGNPGLNITLKKNSTNNVWGPNTSNKLFGSYLDNASSLLFEGLPRSGYDVAILFSGDGGNYSPVTVNGTTWTYNAEGALVEGTTPWGDRSTISDASVTSMDVTGTSSTGRVMFFENQTSARFSIDTVNNNGRGTIAGIQLYLRAGTYEPLNFEAAPTGISITFSEIDWSGKTFVASEETTATLTLPAGATLDLDEAPALALLKLRCEGEASIVASGSGSLANIKAIEVESGTIDFGALQISKLTILANAVAAVQSRDQITTLERLGALKYSGGTAFENYDLSAEPNFSTTIIGKTIASVTDRASTANRGEGFFSVNGTRTLKVVDGGDITVATRFAMADDGASNPVFEMDGGSITVQGTGVNNGTTAGTAVIFGHWGGTPTVNLKRGLLDVSEGGVMIGWTGAPNVTVGTVLNDALNVAGSAVLRAKLLTSHEAWGQNAGGSLVVNPSGVIELGSSGLVLGQYKAEFTVTLAGGEIKAVDNASITYHANVRNPLAVTASSTLSADSDKTLTVSAPLTIANGATLTSKGNVVFATTPTNNGAIAVASGTTTLTAGAEGVVSLASSATLNLILTESLKTSGYTASGVTGEGTVKFFDVDGAEITTGVSGNTYTPPTPRWTATSASGDWNDLSLWSNTTSVPTSGTVVLDFSNVNADTTITIDASATLDMISIVGASGELTFEAEGSNALTVSSISAVADADVTSGVILTTDGTVSIAADATLTVPNNFVYSNNAFSVANDGLPSRVTGPGTLALDLGDATTVDMTGSNPGYKLGIKVVSGTLNFPNSGGDGPGKGRTITVSGDTSTLKFSTGDAGGWNYADGQKIALHEGGKLWIIKRDTFVADVEMRGGEFLLDKAADGGRALDLFHANIFKVLAAADATATTPTESTFTFTNETGAQGRKVLIRNGDVTFDVEANARLTVDVILVAGEASLNAGGTPGKLIKTGAGELVLTAENTYNTATEVNAGVVTLLGNGKFGSGAVTVASGAVVNLNIADGATRTLSSYGTFSGASVDAILRKSGAGTLTLDAAFAGKLDIAAGVVNIGTRRDVTLAAVASGAQVVLTRTSGEQTIVLPTAMEVTPDEMRFTIDGMQPESVTVANGQITIVPQRQTYYWVPAGTDTQWTTVANWRLGSASGAVATTLPEDVAEVVVPVAKGGVVTLTMDANATVSNLEILATGDSGEAGVLTIDGSATLISARGVVVNGVNVIAPQLGVSSVVFSANATLTTTVAAGNTWTLNQISGAGTFIKEGAGALRLQVASADARIVLEDAAITINDGILQTLLIGNDSNPIFKNATLTFGANADGFQSHGWLGLEGVVTVSTATDITFSAANGYVPSLQGAGTLIKEGAGTFTWNLMGNNAHANPITINAGAVAFAGTGSQTAVVTGAGQVKIVADAAVTFTGANTYTGGTMIVAGATLTANTNSLGTGAVTGAGKLVVNGYPSNATVRNSLGAAEWTGTYVNTADNAMKDDGNWLGAVGNANSIVEFTGTNTGYLQQAGSMDATLKVTGSITFNNGWSSGGGYTFNGPLLGDGTLATQNSQTDVLKFLGETKDFAGTITVAGGHCIAFGEQADTGTAHEGKLIVAAGKTANIAAGKAWSAVNGIAVAGTIGGEGIIGKADGTNGTLILKSGAIVDTTAGTLSVATLDTLPEAVKVKVALVPTTVDERVNLMKVKALPGVLTDVTITLLDSNGVDQGANFELVADGEADADGYTMLQVKMKVAATDYTVTVSDSLSSLSEALAGGVFGVGATDYPADPMNLVIDFGNVADGAEAVPGTFDFDNETDLSFVKVTVKGSNGGTITKSGSAMLTVVDLVTTESVAVSTSLTFMESCARADIDAGTQVTLTDEREIDATFATEVSGEGKVIFDTDNDSTVIVNGNNTYTGGTEIKKNATVKMAAAGVLGTGALSGAGTIYYAPVMNGNTPTPPAFVNWTGTLWLEDITPVQGFNLASFGNADSTIGLKDVGATNSNSYFNTSQTIEADLILKGENTISNGGSGMTVTFSGSLFGDGLLLFAQAGGNPSDCHCFTGDLSAFTGTIKFTGNPGRKVMIGSNVPANGYANAIAVVNAVTLNDAATIDAAGNGIKLNGTTVLTGAPTFATKVDVLSGATFNLEATKAIKFTSGTTLSLPDTFNVVFSEEAPLTAGTPVVIFDRADTNVFNLTGTTVVVKKGDTVLPDVQLIATDDGDIAVVIPAMYEAEVVADTTWEDLNWTVGGAPVTSVPSALDRVLLKAATSGLKVTCETPISVASLAIEGEPLKLFFTRDCVTEEMYQAIPTSVALVTTAGGLDEKAIVQIAPLKYSAMATVAQTATAAVAELSLPDSAKTGNTIPVAKGNALAINFKGNGNYPVTGSTAVGLTGYEVVPNNWAQFDGASGANQNLTVVNLENGNVETLATALDYSCNNGHNTGNGNSHAVLRGYLDDGGNGINISIDVPATWMTYKAVIFCATDTANTTFSAKQINGTWYTYSNGALTSSANRPAEGWGDSNSRADLIEGTNTMVIDGLTGDFTLFANRQNNGPRGCVAGIQLIQTSKPEYVYVSSVTATVSAATAGEVVAWDALEWVDDDGNPTTPAANKTATLVFQNDATVDFANVVAKDVQVLGYGHHVRLVNVPETLSVFFSKDTIYRLAVAEDALPAKTESLPGELRYEYGYDASATAYATNPNMATTFAAGFTGEFAANGGTLCFSGGVVTLPNVGGTATKTKIFFSGTSRTTVEGIMALGEAEVVLCDTASVVTSRLSLSDGQPGYTTFMTLEDDAQLLVTGSSNVDANTSSIMIGHWNGSSTLTLRGNAKFVAESADVLVGKTGNTQSIVLEGGEMRVRGVKLSASASGTNTLTLAGGKLLVGDTGIARYGSTTMTLNCEGGTLGALAGTVTLGADAAAAIATLNGEPVFASAEGATLALAQQAPFLTAGKAVNQSGNLQLPSVTLEQITAKGGSITIASEVTATTVEVDAGATLAFDGGVLMADACTFGDASVLQIPVRASLSAGGYLKMATGKALPDLSNTVLVLVLDAVRSDAEKLLPELPIALGTYGETDTAQMRGVALRNNTNNAIADTTLVLKSGDLGQGLYVDLVGADILSTFNVTLNEKNATQAKPYALSQNTADLRPYHYFTAEAAKTYVSIPERGIAVSHLTFTDVVDNAQVVLVPSSMTAPMLQVNNMTIATDVAFDLTAWGDRLTLLAKGALTDLETSLCLVSGGVTQSEKGKVTLMLPDNLPSDIMPVADVLSDGLYLRFKPKALRKARSISVNFTDVTTPLVAPPTVPGAYPVPVDAWNDLNKTYTASELKVANRAGVATATEPIELVAPTSSVAKDVNAPTSMLKTWLNDSTDLTVQLRNLPFDAYRLVLIFSSDLEGAAYAPIQIGETVYTMGYSAEAEASETYTRCNIAPYRIYNDRTGLLTLEIAGDETWGSTNQPEAEVPVVAGQNTLVTDVLTDEEITFTLPAVVYGRMYAGLAALQIVEVPESDTSSDKTFTYTLTADCDLATQADNNGEVWTNGALHKLVITANADVIVTLPADFTADSITLEGAGSVTLQAATAASDVVVKTLNAGALTGNLTVNVPCVNVAFTAPATVTTFNALFNNNGQPYTIVKNATLVLGENSGILTNLETVAPVLTIGADSEGVLRRNYPLDENGHAANAWAQLTLAYKHVVRHQQANGDADNGAASFLIEAGDVFRHLNKFHLSSESDWAFTQTGGEASFENDAGAEGGILVFNGGSAAGKTATISVSGGRLYATKISAWKENSTVNLAISGTGTLALGTDGLRVQDAGTRVNATFTEKGTLELTTAQLNANNTDRVAVNFEGGRITTGQVEASLNIPVAFTANTTTELAPAVGSTLLLNANNSGSGSIEVTQGKVAIATATALAMTETTVKSGAIFEVRNATADATMTNTLVFEAGAELSVTAAEGVTTVKVAMEVDVPDDLTSMRFYLNGTLYSDVSVDEATGTVTFTTPATAEAVTWDAAAEAGVWADGEAGPWADGKTYYDGAAVNLPATTAGKATVTLQGNVRPASLTFTDTTQVKDKYRFQRAADDTTSYLTLANATLNLGNDQIFDLPVATAKNVVVSAINNTYRLIGELSNGGKTASLMSATDGSATAVINRENANGTEAQKHGVWCNDGATLAPQPGEVQIVSAMGTTDTTKRSHLSGSSDVIITGGGTVLFAGRVLETSASDVPYQNKAFTGKIYVQDGATLDITMIRDRKDGDRPRDDHPFFAMATTGNQDTAGTPLWTTEPGIIVQNGATFRVSGCRSIFGGWANRNDANLLAATPLAIGKDATAEFAFAQLYQVFPHGFLFNGNGAKLLATRDMYLSGGTKLEVAAADRDAEGNLLEGITATIASGETTGLVPWEHNGAASTKPLELSVGEGSTLNISANLIAYANSGDSLDRFTLNKTGAGAVRFTRDLIESDVQLSLTEGTLGGTTTFTNPKMTVTTAAGTTVEAGLSIPVLQAAKGTTFAIDPTGKAVLHADNLMLTSGGYYHLVASSLAGEIADAPEAGTQRKVMSWDNATSVETVSFTLDAALIEKGYNVAVRQDGLYLLKHVEYICEMDIQDVASVAVLTSWYGEKKWYRSDDPNKTKRNYDPQDGEAVTAVFVLPPSYANGAPKITLTLTKAATFANVRFMAKGATETDDWTLLTPTVVYNYDLSNEAMPTTNGAKRFTWVLTLVVDGGTEASGLATLEATVPTGYDYTTNLNTVTVYASATQPALNINFTAATAGDGAWIATDADLCGRVPFVGVYWNNASTTSGESRGSDPNFMVMALQAMPVGIEPGPNGQITPCEVTYAFRQATVVDSRQHGDANAQLAASFLTGGNAQISDAIRSAGGMTNSGANGGWQVRVDAVPFKAYDLYLLFAATAEGAVDYPAVRVKVGDQQWRTFSMANGWTAPAADGITWAGEGAPVKGEFVDGKHVLHVRVKATEGQPLEIAPWSTDRNVGLAALQIVRCDDGATLVRNGDGAWSDVAGWIHTQGDTEAEGGWLDATTDAPRSATIQSLTRLDADIPAAVPYLTLSGLATTTITGDVGMLSTGAIDLTGLNPGSSLAFGEDVFAEPVNVILAPDVTITVPESDSGTTVNRWKWLRDDAGNDVNASSATIQKKLNGDLVFHNTLPCNLDIDSGTTWMDLADTTGNDQVDAWMSGNVSGDSGTFGKKGSGTLEYTGNFSLTGMNPLRVEEGVLKFAAANGLMGIESGKTLVATTGGTLQFNANNGAANQTTLLASAGGKLHMTGNFGVNTTTIIRLEDGGTLTATAGATGGSAIGSLIVRGKGNQTDINLGAGYGSGLTVLNDFVLEAGATLEHKDSHGSLRLPRRKMTIKEGATFTSHRAVGVGQPNGYANPDNQSLQKYGLGLWETRTVLGSKGDSPRGNPLEIYEGEVRFALGGATYNPDRDDKGAWILVKKSATLSGNASLGEQVPVTFEEGAIVRSGVPGVKASQLSLHTATFNKGIVFECDLALEKPLRITTSASFIPGEKTIRLLNMGTTLTAAKQLIAWPADASVTEEFVSSEAVALNAKLEVRTTAGEEGLWLVPANDAYTWKDQDGAWSEAKWIFGADTNASYLELADLGNGSVPPARVEANTANVALTLDAGAETTDGTDWKAKSLVTVAGANKTLDLLQGAQPDGEGKCTALYGIMMASDFWKLGTGTLTVSAPLTYGANGENGTLNVASGTMVLQHPLMVETPATNVSPTVLPVAVEIAKGATLKFALEAQSIQQGEATVSTPVTQTFEGAVTGEGAIVVAKADNVVTLASTTDNDLNLDVQAGRLALSGELETVARRAAKREVTVAAGATLEVLSENAMGGATEVTWTLAATNDDTAAKVLTQGDARIRGEIKVESVDTSVPTRATFGSTRAALDSRLAVNVPTTATLTLGGQWQATEDSQEGTEFVKSGKGVAELTGSFVANVPVTVEAGTLSVNNGAISVVGYNNNNSATKTAWTVNAGATLRLGGGQFTLAGTDDAPSTMRLASDSTLECGATSTKMSIRETTIEDHVTFRFGGADGSLVTNALTFDGEVAVEGVVIVNLDAVDLNKLTLSSYTLVSFADGKRSGGSFQLGGNLLVTLAERGWTLRDSGREITLQSFGGNDGYYTWAGDGTEGSTGNGNWLNDFWVKSNSSQTDTTTLQREAWPTDKNVSVMLQDINPLDDDDTEIPEAARTLDWTKTDAQLLNSFYAKNDTIDYRLTSSNGGSPFELNGDFLKAFGGKLTVERPTVFVGDGALRLLGGVTEFTGAVGAYSGDFTTPITVAGEGTELRFSGAVSRDLAGRLDGDGKGTIAQAGEGYLTIRDSVNSLKALAVEKGSVTLSADDQYVLEPETTVNAGAHLTLAGKLAGAGTVQLNIKPGAEGKGTLSWKKTTVASSDTAPRLGLAEDAEVVDVATFVYEPMKGHLVLDPGVLASGFRLEMAAPEEDVTSALWIGAQAQAGANLTVSALTGHGVIGVEPMMDFASDEAWRLKRVLTLAPTITTLAEAAREGNRFEGSFMGAMTPSGEEIRIGLTVKNEGTEKNYFRYAGRSTNEELDTLTIGANTAVEVTGTWGSDVAVEAAGELMGSGTLGTARATVSVPAGAAISAITQGNRVNEDNSISFEAIPAELKVKGILALETGSVLNVKICKNQGKDAISLISTETLQLPEVLEGGAERVEITVNVDLEEGLVPNGVKILGWNGISGSQKINGKLFINGEEQTADGYMLSQEEDGLYIFRKKARFLLILQ